MSTGRAPRRNPRLRILVAVAAVVSGLIVGLIVVMMVSSGGEPGAPAPYRPFLAGRDDRIERQIAKDGPIFYSDPRRGTRALYLDVQQGEIVALHVVPPGGSPDCPVQWDRKQKRYESCQADPVDPATLNRFVITKQPAGEHEIIYVDVRATTPGPVPGPGPG